MDIENKNLRKNMETPKQPTETPEINGLDNDTIESLEIISELDTIKLYDKSGECIFTGDPQSLISFCENNNEVIIGDISNLEGKSLIKFGPADGRGFINRTKIEMVLQVLNLKLKKIEQSNKDTRKINDIREQLGLSSTNELSPEDRERLNQEIKGISRQVYFSHRMSLDQDLNEVAMGINPETGKKFDKINGEIGQFFDAHGISKMNQLNNLLGILENGIDPTKTFYTAPFEISNENRAAFGSALGTAGGTAYKDGIAVLTGGYKQKLSEDGIKHVFINDLYAKLKEPLSILFSQYQFHLLSEQKQIMEDEVKLSENK